ncbi:MAG: tripartite tricarboxylate transporter substrate binding protein [Burkholderiales bacterium]|nr:tripartite tricarboxylate transporter substrate binding protein [Burkholderiales bacterium]
MNKRMRERLSRALVLGAGCLGAGFAGGAAAQWKPQRAVELIVSAAPGGNQDLTARAIQRIWESRKIVSPAVIVNKPGGGGGLAYAYFRQHAPDPHYLMMLAPTLFTSRIAGKGTFDIHDITPIALLFNEYIFTVVRAESPVSSGRDLVRQLRAAPDSLSVAVATAVGNHIHMGVALPMKAAGVDIKRMKIVAFKSSGESLTAALGGHVDVAASTFAAVLPHVSAGRLRILGMSAPQRMGGLLAEVPTWKEQGADAVFDSWRGMVGPKGMQEEHVKFWVAAFEALSQSEEWKQDVERNFRVGRYLGGREAARYWEAQYKALEEALTELGLAGRAQRP